MPKAPTLQIYLPADLLKMYRDDPKSKGLAGRLIAQHYGWEVNESKYIKPKKKKEINENH